MLFPETLQQRSFIKNKFNSRMNNCKIENNFFFKSKIMIDLAKIQIMMITITVLINMIIITLIITTLIIMIRISLVIVVTTVTITTLIKGLCSNPNYFHHIPSNSFNDINNSSLSKVCNCSPIILIVTSNLSRIQMIITIIQVIILVTMITTLINLKPIDAVLT